MQQHTLSRIKQVLINEYDDFAMSVA